MTLYIVKQTVNFILIFTFVFVWGCVSVQNFLESRPVVKKESVIKQNGGPTLPRVWIA